MQQSKTFSGLLSNCIPFNQGFLLLYYINCEPFQSFSEQKH
jgi:hypothetical protein